MYRYSPTTPQPSQFLSLPRLVVSRNVMAMNWQSTRAIERASLNFIVLFVISQLMCLAAAAAAAIVFVVVHSFPLTNQTEM